MAHGHKQLPAILFLHDFLKLPHSTTGHAPAFAQSEAPRVWSIYIYAHTKEVTSGSDPTPGRPQENWQAVLDNCWGTFVPGDLLSISFIGVALYCRTVKGHKRKITWMGLPEICCSACFCTRLHEFIAEAAVAILRCHCPICTRCPQYVVPFLYFSTHIHLKSLTPHSSVISDDLQKPDYAKGKCKILSNLINIIYY